MLFIACSVSILFVFVSCKRVISLTSAFRRSFFSNVVLPPACFGAGEGCGESLLFGDFIGDADSLLGDFVGDYRFFLIDIIMPSCL